MMNLYGKLTSLFILFQGEMPQFDTRKFPSRAGNNSEIMYKIEHIPDTSFTDEPWWLPSTQRW